MTAELELRFDPLLGHVEPKLLEASDRGVCKRVEGKVGKGRPVPKRLGLAQGRDAGFGGMGFTPASQGGTHIVEKNLTRLTVAIAILFTVNTVALYRVLA